jgi:hypothetical protein
MPVDYQAAFPIDARLLPDRLRLLLEPVGLDPALSICVSERFEHDPHGPERERLHMIMAVMPEAQMETKDQPQASVTGVVAHSVPAIDRQGGLDEFVPSVDGFDYIVASWGSGSFYTYMLAEKVWMSLGLSMRVLGQEVQRVVFDDLGAPEFGIADGEVSGAYYYESSRDVRWRMSNEYLRRYLWMRGSWGVRVFHYESLLADHPDIRKLMKGERHVVIAGDTWFEVDIREHEGGLLLQVWAKVFAVSPERCPSVSVDGLFWPGIPGEVTRSRANNILEENSVYLDDRFLEKYEQSSLYSTSPFNDHGRWLCSPSYLGQWAFSDCVREGRNLIKVPLRSIYKGVPDREISHARQHAIPPEQAAQLDLGEEHIACKVDRLVQQLLTLGDNLAALSTGFGAPKDPEEIVKLSRSEIRANGWTNLPDLQRLAQVAPLSMTEQSFLARCKSLHELYQRIPDGFIREILERAGHARKDVKDLRSLKLLQVLTNMSERLNAQEERIDAFSSAPEDMNAKNQSLAALFVNNDLRVADAHHAGGILKSLAALDFDIAGVSGGYGRALDYVFDRVIASFEHINAEIGLLLSRKA